MTDAVESGPAGYAPPRAAVTALTRARTVPDSVAEVWSLLADDKAYADHDGLPAGDADQACQWATTVCGRRA
ncbi:hypothetical protein [Micromonospora rosaria]|uniref:hypothetical protein n=1 Tax=Micromonospora rosaria TaxID=47874 RepID=UPI000A9BDE4D|nr:hypothetical protein [Micromonospora rosaria]